MVKTKEMKVYGCATRFVAPAGGNRFSERLQREAQVGRTGARATPSLYLFARPLRAAPVRRRRSHAIYLQSHRPPHRTVAIYARVLMLRFVHN